MPRRPSALLAALLAAVLGLASCEANPPATLTPTPGPTGSPRPPAEVYAEIRAAVAAIRGLEPTADVEPVTIDVDQLETNLAAEFDKEYPAAKLAAVEGKLIGLGLLPAGSSLRELTLDLQAGQVAGYYSPDQDELFVVNRSGAALGAAERVTYAHEFTHQLQDQHVDLGSLGLDAPDQSDRAQAILALIEGDAVSAQSAWMAGNLTPRELGELLAVALGPASLEALQRAPRYLRETALFPYEDGFSFVSRLLAEGGYGAVDAAYGDPPDSTEQVLHPDKYLRREAPIQVAIPEGIAGSLGGGWVEAGRDTLGELLLRIWLREGGVTVAEARAATAGWGGDRLILLRGPDEEIGIGLITAWDSAAEASEFSAAASTAVTALDSQGLVVSDGIQRVIVAMGDRAADILAALAD